MSTYDASSSPAGAIDVERTTAHVVAAIDGATEHDQPFHYLRFANVFPADVYAGMLAAMPSSGDYGHMSGRARMAKSTQGGSARTKIDLFPEAVRGLPEDKKGIWGAVGEALRSPQVRDAFVRRLTPALERRFGSRLPAVGFFAAPLLTRDLPGYRIGIHADTPRKGITAQFYLPRDASIAHIGTVFHKRNPDRSYTEVARMPFVPNSGYAFAVLPDSHHSVDTVGPEVSSRDSILHNYFVEDSWFLVVRNRCRRIGYWLRGMGWQKTGDS